MKRKFTAKSTITEPTTEPIEAEEIPAVEPAIAAPPDVLPSGLERKVWAGLEVWHCPRCGTDTFDRETAETHACKGRVVKPYKGD